MREEPADEALQRRLRATLEGALGLRPFEGDALEPWHGWLAYALLRYRARVDRAVAALGGRTVIGRSGHLDEPAMWFAANPGQDRVTCAFDGDDDHVSCRRGTGAEGDTVLVSPRWIDVEHLAFSAVEVRGPQAPGPYRRLARWVPSAPAVTVMTRATVQRFGGTLDDRWARLPDAWEPLVAAADALDEHAPATITRLARAFSDVELHAPDDRDAARTRRDAHAAWVFATWIDRGTYVGLDLADHLYTGAELVEACETVMRRNVELTASAISVLHQHPTAPVSPLVRKAVSVLRPDAEWMVRILSVAAPYLTEHDVDLEILRDKVRAVAATPRVEVRVGTWTDRPIYLSLITWALRHEPAAALTLIREGLRQRPSWWANHLIALLVLRGQPWCVRELETAHADNPALRDELTHALERCRLGDARLGDGLAAPLRNALHFWRLRRNECPDVPDDFDPLADAADARSRSVGRGQIVE